VDEYDASARSGWSVTVVGPSRVLTDAGEVTAIHKGGLTPWVPAPDACVIAVRIARVSGRRVGGSGDPATGVTTAVARAVPGPAMR